MKIHGAAATAHVDANAADEATAGWEDPGRGAVQQQRDGGQPSALRPPLPVMGSMHTSPAQSPPSPTSALAAERVLQPRSQQVRIKRITCMGVRQAQGSSCAAASASWIVSPLSRSDLASGQPTATSPQAPPCLQHHPQQQQQRQPSQRRLYPPLIRLTCMTVEQEDGVHQPSAALQLPRVLCGDGLQRLMKLRTRLRMQLLAALLCVSLQLSLLLSPATAALMGQPPFLASLRSTAGAAAAAAGAAPFSIQSAGQSFTLQVLQKHNSSGALPPIPALNELLRQSIGAGAMQLNERAAFSTAAVATNASSRSSPGGLQLPDMFSALLPGQRGPTGLPFPPFSVPPPIGGFGGSLGGGGAGLTAPSAASSLDLPFDAGLPFESRLPLETHLGTTHASDTGSTSTTSLAEDEWETAERAYRFGVYDALYGYLNYAGFQLIMIGNLLEPRDLEIATPLYAAGNELVGIGYLALGIKGSEEIEVAQRALAELHRRRALNASAVAPVNGNGNGNGGDGLLQDGVSQPGRSSLIEAVSGAPFPAYRTQGVGMEGGGLTWLPRAASEDALVCPLFLYASWLRLENQADTGSGTHAHSTSDTSSRVLLRFTDSSVERLETAERSGRQRVRQQRWTGTLTVECEFPSSSDSDATAATAAGATAPAVSGPAPPAAELTAAKNSSLRHSTPPSQAPAASNLLDALRAALVVPAHMQASVSVSIESDRAGSSPRQWDFTFVSLRANGTLHAILVERSRADQTAAGTGPDVIEHRRAFIRLS